MKSFFLVFAIVLGILIPQAYIFSPLIQYFLMLMLFIAFLDITLTYKMFSKNIVLILLTNIALGFIWFDIIFPLNHTLGIIAFMTAITPTAIAAPAVIHLLKGKVVYATAAVLLTNIIIAVCLPFFINLLKIPTLESSPIVALENISFVIFLPLISAQIVRKLLPGMKSTITKYKMVAFYIWVINIFLALAKSSHFIRNHTEISFINLLVMGGIILLICIVNFSLGKQIGGRTFGLEASQSLGQKNTMFTVWYALTFLTPIIALGPVFYLVYHNMYNAYQMIRISNKHVI